LLKYINANLLFMKYLIRILLTHFTYRITNLMPMQFHAVANYFRLKWRAATYSIKIKNNFKFANNLINNRAMYTNMFKLLFFHVLL